MVIEFYAQKWVQKRLNNYLDNVDLEKEVADLKEELKTATQVKNGHVRFVV